MGAQGVTLTKKIGIFFFQKSNFFSKFKRGDAHRSCKGDGREALKKPSI